MRIFIHLTASQIFNVDIKRVNQDQEEKLKQLILELFMEYLNMD